MIAKMLCTVAGAAFLVGSAASAQTSGSGTPILDELNSTPDITILGSASDPNVRKANAVVNGEVVTDTDIDQRLNLVLAANPTDVEEQEKLRLKMQVVRNLIDEKLQIQESAENDIIISDAELADAYARVAGNFKMNPEQFKTYLRERGTSEMAIQQQIHAELAWQRLLRRRVEPFVNVGDDEVETIIARMEASKGTDEYRIGELVFYTTPATAATVMQDAQQIVDQLKKGASFVAYARQYSQSSTATVGGDLGWVQLEQLSPELQPVISQLPEGQITAPIQLPGKIVILALIDKRQILTASQDDAILSLKQLSVPVAESTSEAQAQDLVARLQTSVSAMGGCGGVEKVAEEYGGSVTVNDQVRLGDLPPQLKSLMGQLQTGQSTPPFGSLDDGIKVLTMCGREELQNARAPDFDNMYAQIEQQRVNMMARRYLRDLRRDAIIDYR